MGDQMTQIMMEDFAVDFSGAMLIFYLVYLAFMLAITVGSYVLQSVSLHTIAKRRGIHKPWLSWLPIGEMWIVGCISDQYQYVVKGRVKNKRKALLVLNIILWACVIAIYVLLGVMLVQAFTLESLPSVDHTDLFSILGPTTAMMGISLVMSGISIAVMVIRYIALYDLYTSCNPKNNVVFLVLGIVFSFLTPFFIFANRNRDGGMPPRKQPAPSDIPDAQWQPAQSPREPWDNSDE